MAFDLKPLTSEIIHKMNYAPHSLWIVKLNDEIFGPFEVESLKHYAIENEQLFEHALATRMDTNDWQPFFSYAQFHPIAEHDHDDAPVIEKYWIMNFGQKTGPLSRQDIDKKIELGILSMTDLVSVDDGETWLKFFSHGLFNPQSDSISSPPMAPLESSFQRAKEDLQEIMDNQERTGTHIGLAALTYLGQSKGKRVLNLEEMDLKSLNETEISRSLKWAVPSAVAGLAVLAMVGNFLFSSSSSDMVATDEKTETKVVKNNPVRKNTYKERSPASYKPLNQQRSALTNVPVVQENEYPSHIETHYNEPDPNTDQALEAELNPPPEPQEHSLVSNTGPENETLDQAMGADPAIPEVPPEQPVEAVSDF